MYFCILVDIYTWQVAFLSAGSKKAQEGQMNGRLLFFPLSSSLLDFLWDSKWEKYYTKRGNLLAGSSSCILWRLIFLRPDKCNNNFSTSPTKATSVAYNPKLSFDWFCSWREFIKKNQCECRRLQVWSSDSIKPDQTRPWTWAMRNLNLLLPNWSAIIEPQWGSFTPRIRLYTLESLLQMANTCCFSMQRIGASPRLQQDFEQVTFLDLRRMTNPTEFASGTQIEAHRYS